MTEPTEESISVVGPDTPRMTIAEFRESGLLLEINRQILHPRGLAMCVNIDEETGQESLGWVMDCREDDEGIWYDDSMDDEIVEKSERVRAMLTAAKRQARLARLGWIIQPIPWRKG